MASPVYVDTDEYGESSGGDWPTSRTLAAPSFSSDRVLVALVADYVHDPAGGNFHHWNVPSRWELARDGGVSLTSGFDNNIYTKLTVYSVHPSRVAATIRPEKSDDTLFTPSSAAAFNYWRVFVTGWTERKVPNDSGTANAGETRTVLPFEPPSPICDGVGEGTFAQFTMGNLAYGGGPTGISTANGFADDLVATGFRVASKAFAATVSTDACIYTKTATGFAIGAVVIVSVDTPVVRSGGPFIGLRVS